ncbi:hypothetical protein ACOZ38_06890 [Sphaerisporangium viridialbum]|uniref:hypothetical protein n=1 Tax=Sphaerisporangium viridialbum TaxID=46189 RepID=UPI003C70F015
MTLVLGEGPFGAKSAGALGTLTSPLALALALGAVVLVTRFGEPTPRARLVNLVAVAALAAAALFGFVSLVGVLLGGGTGGWSVIEYLLTGVPALALTAVSLVYALSILPPGAPSAVRPRQGHAEQPAPHGNGQGLFPPQPFQGEHPGYGPGGHPDQPPYGPAQHAPAQNAPASALPALPPAPHNPPQPYGPGDQRPAEAYGQQPGAEPYPQPQFAQQGEQPQFSGEHQPQFAQQGEQQRYGQQQGDQQFGRQGDPQFGQQFGQQSEPQFGQQGESQFGRQDESQARPYAPAGEAGPLGDTAYAPQHSQPLDAYAAALRSEPYGQGSQGSQADSASSQPSGSYGQPPASPYAPQPSAPYGEQNQQPGQQSQAGQQGQQTSDPYAPQAATPYVPSGGGAGAFGMHDAFTTGARQAVPEPLTAPTAFDQPHAYGRPPAQDGGPYGQASPLDQPSSSYGQTGPQTNPLDKAPAYGQTGPLDQPPSYGQTGPQAVDQPSYGQTGPQTLDQSSYGQSGPQANPMDQTQVYGQMGTQAGEQYGGYSGADFGRQPEPSPLYAEAADARQQQIAQAYQQAQSYQQSQGGGSPSEGRSEHSGTPGGQEYTTGTQPVRTPEYASGYSGSPFGHPQSAGDSSGYSRPPADAQPYRPAQEQPYQDQPYQDQPYQRPQDQGYPQPQDRPYPQAPEPYPQAPEPYPQEQPYQPQQQAWEEPAVEKTVRFDPKAFQNDPLNAPMPPSGPQGHRDEPIDPTAIYAPDRSAQARPEESGSREPAGPGVDQGSRWYGSDR